MHLPLKIDKKWTLFLDRDGVINNKLRDDYVKNIQEFEFIPFAKEAIALLNRYFGKIIVITNQQGVGKGLMKETDVVKVHEYMNREIEKLGGKIDAVYFCPELAESNSYDRKPETGMAYKAKSDFRDIDFTKTIMVGDSITDMEFGKKLGLVNILIAKKTDLKSHNNLLINYVFTSLIEFSEFIYENNKQ